MSTPFDSESLDWFDDLNISIIKVASCSVDDWPLLRDICNKNKKIIISTAGATMQELKKVYDLFKFNKKDFAFMHCVAEYPTPIENSNLNRITQLKKNFCDIEVGFSTHESPKEESVAPLARALGCTILEKHIGVGDLNDYSYTSDQMIPVIKSVLRAESALYNKKINTAEASSLRSLKRGVYVNKDLKIGDKIGESDIFYAMPLQAGQLDASQVDNIIGNRIIKDLKSNSIITKQDLKQKINEELVSSILSEARETLFKANINLKTNEDVEISAHYGLENFSKYGVLIINKINREYCKKLLVMFEGQSHPCHHHIKKEEAFELLHGDCTLNLNNKDIQLEKGSPVLINRGVKHSFFSKEGCVIEEVSTTHIEGDSIYEDPNINSYKLSERKIKSRI
jgi:quercetin dioxygenase-like cupin family protein